MTKKNWILISIVSLYSCGEEGGDSKILSIRNGRTLPTLNITFEFDDGKSSSSSLMQNNERDNDISMLYNPELGRYTYLNLPVRKVYFNKADYLIFTENKVLYKNIGQNETILINNYNQLTWSLSSTIDFNGIAGGPPVVLETVRDSNSKKIIKIKPYF